MIKGRSKIIDKTSRNGRLDRFGPAFMRTTVTHNGNLISNKMNFAYPQEINKRIEYMILENS